MEKIPLGGRKTHDGIYGPPKFTILFDQKSLEQGTNLMGTRIEELLLQNSLPTGK